MSSAVNAIVVVGVDGIVEDAGGKSKTVVAVGEGLGDRDLSIRVNRACAERWPLWLVGRDVALVTAHSCCAAARASARVDGVFEGSGSDAGGSSS